MQTVKNMCVSNDKCHSLLIQFCKTKLESKGDNPKNHLSRKCISQICVFEIGNSDFVSIYFKFTPVARWPYRLSRWPKAACLLGSRFRISLWACVFYCCVYCVLCR